VKKFKYRPLSLALACMLAPYQYLHASDVPLDIIQESYGGNQFGYRLGINVGVNGATPEEYLFDTGSDSFNIDVGTNTGGHGAAWFPNQPGVAQSAPYAYLYGNGTYGYWQSDTTVSSVQFYNSASGAKVGSIATPQGLPVAIAQDWMGTQASLAPDTPGQAITTIGGNTLYQDLTWQQSLNQGNAPEEGRFYGTFGTGDFGNGIAGSLTKSGYIVEANGAAGDPGKCGSACLIVGLTPALRAQFLSVVPWIGGGQGTFPLSGAPAANQFDTQFLYVLTDGKHSSSATLPTLFDTGTPNIMIIDNDLGVLTHETALGHINSNNDEIPGITLTATGVSAGSQPSSIVTGNDASGDYSNVVTVGPYGGFPDSAIYGISFFFQGNRLHAVLRLRQSHHDEFHRHLRDGTTRSGGRDLGYRNVPGGIGSRGQSQRHQYLHRLDECRQRWLAGSGWSRKPRAVVGHPHRRNFRYFPYVAVDGGPLALRLGGTTLVLTNAVGTFSGQLADGGLGGGVGGRLIVAGGKEMLTGHSTYTGWTGVSAPGELDLSSSGSLAGSAINLGVLSNSGLISGSVINRGQLVDNGSIMGSVSNDGMLTGQGRIGGDLVVSGTVAPGNAAASYRTLTVSGNYTQSAGSAYLAQLSPLQAGTSSLIAVNGNATLAPGAKFGLVVASPGQLYSLGARYTVLTANQGLSGTYTLGQAALSAVLGIDPIYDAKHFSLEVVQRRALMAVGGTRNETAALAALQHLPSSNTLFTAVTSLQSDGQIRNAADQLDGEIHASVQNTFLEDSRYVRDAVFGRLRQATQDEPTAAAAATSAPTVQTQSNGLAWWGQFVGSWGHGDGDGNAAAMSQTLSGFLIGADMPVGENTSVGVASGYTQTALNISKGTSSAASDDAYLSLYSGTQLGAFGLSMGAAYTQHSLDTSRTIALADFTDHTQSSSKAYTAQVFGEAGYQFQLKTTTLEPFAQAAYVRLTDDAFQEHGGAAALAGSGDDRAVTYMTLGAHAATNFQFNGDLFTAHGTLGWRHSFGDVNPDTAMTFTGGSSFNVEGLPIARNALVVDTGLDLHIARNAVLSLSYSGQIARHAVDSGVRGGFIWRF
jgi:subtilase-type serine protease